MILEMSKIITFAELDKLNMTLEEAHSKGFDERIADIIANQVLCVKNGVWFRIKHISFCDSQLAMARKYRLVIDTIDYIEEDKRNMIRHLPLQELLPTKPSRKVSAEESCTL